MRETFYSWNEYSFLFQQKAQEHNIPKNVVFGLLVYAEKLSKNNVPVIYDIKHLSFLTGYRESYIRRAMTNSSNFYRTFAISKRNGKPRMITEPLPGLKAIQYWILNNIIKVAPVNKLNNAYAPGKSIVTNSKYHIGQSIVLNLDIEKYFDNITFSLVRAFFIKFGYNIEVSQCLARLCTLNNGLPQGSPSSPYLSSVLTEPMDKQLFSYCRSWRLRYSRYADDITISGKFHPGTIINGVKKIVDDNGFLINSSKTTITQQHQRQLVTGIIVNKKLSISSRDLKKIRQQIYYINKFGLESHVIKVNLTKEKYLQHLLGKVNFFLFVKKDNEELIAYKKQLIELIKQSV